MSAEYPMVVFAFAALYCALSLLCMAMTVLWRIRNVKHDRAWLESQRKWEEIFARSTTRVPENLPSIESHNERFDFLVFWCEYRASLRGESAQLLNRLATRLSLDDFCMSLLSSHSVSNQNLAIIALGFMGVKRAYDSIQKHVFLKDPVLSFVAARALIQIDRERSFVWLLPIIVERADWHSARVFTLFQDVGPEVLSKQLPSYILDSDNTQSARLVPFLRLLPSDVFVTQVRRILERSHTALIKQECHALLKELPFELGDVPTEQDTGHLNPLAFDPRVRVRLPAIKQYQENRTNSTEQEVGPSMQVEKSHKRGQEKG